MQRINKVLNIQRIRYTTWKYRPNQFLSFKILHVINNMKRIQINSIRDKKIRYTLLILRLYINKRGLQKCNSDKTPISSTD